MSTRRYEAIHNNAPSIIGDRRLELLNPYNQVINDTNNEKISLRDPFAGHSYAEVCQLHFPLGVQTYESVIDGRVGPTLEFICAKPINSPEGNDILKYDPELAVVMLAPFINPVSDGKGHPNHIALRAAAIADGANADVIAFGHPSIVGDGLSHKVRNEMANADYGFLANEIAKAVKSQGKKRVIVYGYSQGGELAAYLAMAMDENGIEVVGVVSAAPPGVIERSIVQLASDFSDKTGMPTVKKEIERLGSPAMNTITGRITSILSLAKIAINTIDPTSIAMARGYGKGVFTKKMLEMAKRIPGIPILLSASNNDKVCPIEYLAATRDLLEAAGADVTLFENRGYYGDNGHAWGDYITDQASLVALHRVQTLLKKAA